MGGELSTYAASWRAEGAPLDHVDITTMEARDLDPHLIGVKGFQWAAAGTAFAVVWVESHRHAPELYED